jgi:hypothetical protein
LVTPLAMAKQIKTKPIKPAKPPKAEWWDSTIEMSPPYKMQGYTVYDVKCVMKSRVLPEFHFGGIDHWVPMYFDKMDNENEWKNDLNDILYTHSLSDFKRDSKFYNLEVRNVHYPDLIGRSLTIRYPNPTNSRYFGKRWGIQMPCRAEEWWEYTYKNEVLRYEKSLEND